MSQLEILVGQFGRPSKRRASVAMLLPLSDVPGKGWKQLGQTSWRVGLMAGSVEFLEIGHRARKSGAFTALRRFRQEDPPRGFFIQVTPYASQQDAEDVLTVQGISNKSGMRWPGSMRLAERNVTDIEVPGVVHPKLYEYDTARGDLSGYQRFIQARVDNIVFSAVGSASEPGWPWDELVPIAQLQSTRIRKQLDELAEAQD